MLFRSITEQHTVIDNPSGIYIGSINEHVCLLRRHRKLESDITWHGDILVAKFDLFTQQYIDVSGADIPLIYNILTRPVLDTPSVVEKLIKAAESTSHVEETTSDTTTTT